MSELKLVPDPLSVPVSGPLSVTPLYAAGDEIVWWDGAHWNELAAGTSGPINLTGDVLGTGTSSIPTTVLGLQGRAVSNAAPLDGQVLAWSSSAGQWHPIPPAVVTGGGSPPGGATGTVQINAGAGNFGGITISGDATLNYSTGALSLSTSGVVAGTYQGITFDDKGRATTAVNMNYAPLADPHFTGVPTANSIPLATTAYVDSLYSPGAYIDSTSPGVTLADGVAINLTSITLPAGDWIVNGSAYFSTGAALNYNFMLGANTTSATLPGIPYYTQISPAGVVAGGSWTLNIPERKYSVTVPTTVYLVVRAGFGSGAVVTAQGHIAAEQVQKLVTGGGGGGGGMTALTGDVTGSGTGSVATTVARLQGRNMASAAPVSGQVLGWDGAQWLPTAPVAGGTGITSITFASPLTGGTITTPGQTVGLGQVPVGLLGGGTGATSSTYLRGDMTWQAITGGGVTSITQGTGMSFSVSPIVATGTINLANTAVTPGPYTNANITIDQQGRITAAANGTAGSGGAPGGAVNNAQYYATSTTFGGSSGLTLSATAVTGLNVGGDLTGDTYYRSASGFTRLAAGTVNYVLTSGGAGAAPSWQVAPGAGGGITGTATNNQLAVGTGSSSLGPLGTLGATTTLLHGNAAGLPTWGAVVTGDITNANVTYAKIQNVAAWSVVGNATVAAAAPADVTMTGTAAVTRVVSSTSAAKTSGNKATWDANGNLVDGGAAGVTSVSMSMPGTIWSVGGSPVTTTGTLAVTVAGTTGGIPYFSGATAMGTSGLLTQRAVVLGGGSGATPYALTTGLGTSGFVLTSQGASADPIWAAAPGGGSGTVASSTVNQVPYYSAATTVTGNPSITSSTTGALTINASTGTVTLPAVTAGPVQVAGVNGVGPWIEMYSFGGANANYAGFGAAGTISAPLVTASGSTLVGLTGFGYTGSAYTGQRGSVVIQSSEAWTTNRGTSVIISTTPTGTTTFGICATFNTGLVVGAPTAAATPTAGDVNAQRVLVQGLPVTAFGAPSLSWIVGASPNGAILFVADRACTVATAKAVIVTSGNAGSTLTIKKNNTTTLNTTAFPLDGATGVSTITLNTTATLAANDYINITTSGTVTTGAGNVTVYVS